MKTPPYGMPWMPPWMMMPWGGQDQQQQVSYDLIVPPRVRQAMEFLALLSSKTQQRAAACENAIELIDGQKLCGEEENARDSACLMLAKYFDGNLRPDIWERLRYDALKKRAEGREGTILKCLMCANRHIANPNCEMCKGTGRIFVSAFGAGEAPPDGVVVDEDSPPEA